MLLNIIVYIHVRVISYRNHIDGVMVSVLASSTVTAFMCKMDIFLFISHHVLCIALKGGEGYFIRSVQPVDEDGDGGGGELK
jgi:hypothetical protein